MTDFSKIEWSSEEYTIEKFVNRFPLPQVVQIKTKPRGNSTKRRQPKESLSNDVFILHCIRNSEKIRAIDSLKNEFFLPLDSTAKVEVIWKDYKGFYDNVEELFADFPAHVLVVKEDGCLGIKKGDVLKLKRKITNRENKYLQCAFLDNVRTDVNIPFSYKGLFKTLGDLKDETICLNDAVEFCKLPRVVRFIDNKLKMKRIDGTSKSPTRLCSLEQVTLHEVIDHVDVIASKTTSDGEVIVTSIPLEREIKVLAPTAASRSDPHYTRLCAIIEKETTEEMVRKIGVLHRHWVVFHEDDDDTQGASTWNKQLYTLANLSFEDDTKDVVIEAVEVEINTSPEIKLRISLADEKIPAVPPKSPKQVVLPEKPPPIPPKIPLKVKMGQGLSRTPPSPRRPQKVGEEQCSLTVPISTSSRSISLPRMLQPSQSEMKSKIYEPIWIRQGTQQTDDQQQQGNKNNRRQFQDVEKIIKERFGGCDNLDGADGYVPMAGHVPHLQQERLYESIRSQSHLDNGQQLGKVRPNSSEVYSPTGQERAQQLAFSQPPARERSMTEIILGNAEKMKHLDYTRLQKRRSYDPNDHHQSQRSTFPRETAVQSDSMQRRSPVGDRPPCPTPQPSPAFSSQSSRNSEDEIHIKIRFEDSGSKFEPYSDIPSIKLNADRRNDLGLHRARPTKAPPGLDFIKSKELKSWSHKEVSKFLKFVNLEQYMKVFKDKKVDGHMLANLDAKALKDLNITNASHVATLMKFVHECIKHEHSAIPNEYLPS